MKINLGAGNNKRTGYVNIDIRETCNPDLVLDITKGLPFDDNSVDEVLAYDFLEHIPIESTIPVITDIWRVMKPGTNFVSFTPDAEHGQGAWMDPTHINFWVEGRWLYFSQPAYRDLYNIKAHFSIEYMKRSLTDIKNRIYHLHVIAKAVKHV